MENPLTFKVESYLGIGFLALFSGFLIAFFFIAVKNLHSELDILEATQVEVRTPLTVQRELIQRWMETNHIELPKGQSYRHLLQMYPDRPWLN
ncbi:MAG: hypothetical protein AAB864_01805 [Patescibacteria group bacterium]